KNLKIYADTVKAVKAKYPRVRALVVGDGPAGEGLRKLLPQAVYTGYLAGVELARAYASSDVFLFPSDTESFGNVTLEAMASGLPCVFADASGSKSLFDHAVNGYLVPVAEPETFIVPCSKLVKDDGLRKKLGDA